MSNGSYGGKPLCFGKYRGTVVDNIDPLGKGRVQTVAPDILGLQPKWAMPCLPSAGVQSGLVAIPPIGAGVWVEFEQGDSEYPIWVGCFWGTAAEVPALARTIPPGVSGFTLQTVGQNGIVVSDAPGPTGGIMLKSASGATIIVNDTGIYIQNGQGASIVLNGSTVTVNQGALTVM